MTEYKDAHRARAEAQFRKADVAPADATKAARDAEAAARDANTERLKGLRLARDEAARHAVATNKARRSLRRR